MKMKTHPLTHTSHAQRSLVYGAVCMILATSAARAMEAASKDEGELEEVVVTSTRQAELLSKVPLSVTAFGQEQMDSQGLKQMDDLVRLTPGLNLTRIATGGSQIAIRGISPAPAPAPPASTLMIRRYRYATWASEPAALSRVYSISSGSRCCADPRARCSVPVRKAAPSASSSLFRA